MKIGIIGLGKMGGLLALNLIDKKINVVGYNRSPQDTKLLAKKGLIPSYSYSEFIEKLDSTKIIWLMVPAGQAVDSVIDDLLPYLKKGDYVIDGGNSNYLDSIRRYSMLKKKSINFIDCGTSGGLEGARNGACLTIGGDYSSFKKLEFLFKSAASKNGYLYCGKSGAGHYVKTVHNGIEYAMLEAYAEGFEILSKSDYGFDLSKISDTWSSSSVIRSWLTELATRAFKKDPKLSKISPIVGGGETGLWTIDQAKALKLSAPIIQLSIDRRKKTSETKPFSGRVINALRHEFGGHPVDIVSKNKK